MVVSVCALPAAEWPSFHEMRRFLIARAHPELAGIRILSLNTAIPADTAAKYPSLADKLGPTLDKKLKDAAISVSPRLGKGGPDNTPDLTVRVEILTLEDSKQHVFRTQTSLARAVYLTPEAASSIKVEVWKRSSPLQTASAEDLAAKIADVVTRQIDAFITDWTTANPPPGQAPATRTVTTMTEKSAPASPQSTPAEYKYVASKNSKVFHLSGCSSAKRISAKNLVGYKTRTDAIDAGKRPCKLCKP